MPTKYEKIKSVRCLYLQVFVLIFFNIIISNKFDSFAIAGNVPDNPEEIPWHISAVTLTFDQKTQLYIAKDDVVLTGGETRLEADYIEFSDKTKNVLAKGNVILISGKNSISCNSISLNLSTQTGIIDQGTIFIEENNFYITGKNINKTGKFSYKIDKGSITSCTGESPAWKFTGNNIKVTIEGYGTANNAVFWAKKLPVIYIPYLLFPAKTKRQTGLLFPKISSSDRKGFEFEQPLFFNLSRNSDATVYADYMSDRGLKLGNEFRYIMNNKTKGAIYFDFLNDEKLDDKTDLTKNYSFSATPQRTNKDRFWFRMKHNQELDNGFTAKLDIDIVSDEDYLLEFKDGFTGYTRTNEYFEHEFNTSLDEYDDYIRKNSLNINKTWSNYSFNVTNLWYDNIRSRRQNIDDTTLQTLPSIEFNASRQQAFNSDLFYSVDSEYKSFYRQDTTSNLVNGQRIDVYSKAYLPFKPGKVLNFEPFFGVRETIWHVNDFTDINGNSDSFRTRNMYNTGAELSTKLNKIFVLNNSFTDKIQHELVPKLEYVFVPDIVQDDLPLFDDLDKIGEQNQLTWSLINNFTSGKLQPSSNGEEQFKYHDFAYIKVYQTLDIKKKKDNEIEPFSDIFLETELNPCNFFSFDMDFAWSPYNNHFNTLNISNTFKDNRGDSLITEYRYLTTVSESLYSKVSVNLTDKLKAFYSIEQNLKEQKNVENLAGMTLEKSCWTFNVYFSQSPDEKSISLLIKLHGIGEFGTK